MIRTIIVDDELLAGVGVRTLIDGKEDIAVSGVFEMPAEAIQFLKENIVDIVITDIEMADISGLEFIKIIREENLADGIIILSCHDEFSYAQEAISRGTDSYLLKHNVSSEILVKEIHKVYQKNKYNRSGRVPSKREEKSFTGREVYTVGVLRIVSNEFIPNYDKQQVEGTMLTNLMEKIVSRYEMGTLFSPYNREMFIIFQDDKKNNTEERRRILFSNISIISKTVQQYIDGKILFGLSIEFGDLKQVNEKYREAVRAIEMSFYKPEKTVFTYSNPLSDISLPFFSVNNFLEENGMEIFETELDSCLQMAKRGQIRVQDLQGHLLQAVNKMVYQILQSHPFSESLVQKWSSDVMLISAITQEKNVNSLRENLTEVMGKFQKECLAELQKDSLFPVFEFIEKNLEEKLSLVELAELSCMSVPTFSKKFKEQTNMTLVQYLNERRIERAKFLLQNKENSLEVVAEKSGFSNANYLVRVFKKVTGQTISEYRK